MDNKHIFKRNEISIALILEINITFISMKDQENVAGQIPEIPVQIIVTEEECESTNTPNDATESVLDKKQTESDDKDTGDTEERLRVPGTDIRRPSITLQNMDQEHAWLSELDEKSMNVETAFISKIQYVAISNHCQKYLEKLSSDESMMQYRMEFSNLFEKFRTAFTGSQQLHNKLNENKAYTKITNEENRKLKIKLEQKSQQIEELEKHLVRLQDELSNMARQKSALQRMFSEWQEERKLDELKEQASQNLKTLLKNIFASQTNANFQTYFFILSFQGNKKKSQK